MKKFWETFINPSLFLCLSLSAMSASFVLGFIFPSLAGFYETVEKLCGILGVALILRPFLRKGLDEIKYGLHHIDYGSFSETPGEDHEGKQEKLDVEAQYYGTITSLLYLILDFSKSLLS
jgi:hypothetical protein